MEEQAMQIRRLTALLNISQSLGSTLNLNTVLEQVLQILDQELGMKRGSISLLEENGTNLAIQYSHGLSEGERKRGR